MQYRRFNSGLGGGGGLVARLRCTGSTDESAAIQAAALGTKQDLIPTEYEIDATQV